MGPKTSLIDKAQFPKELAATCGDCRMCKPKAGEKPYLFDTKCCTYYPFIPNYSVGGILAQGGEGARRVTEIIRSRSWALPIGLVPPPSYQLKYRNKHPAEFGRNPDFRCPFLNQGQCTVWSHRNSECSTYFCVHDEGEAGKVKWFKISEDVFKEEMGHSQNNMLDLGFLWPEVEHNLKYIKFTPDDVPDDEKPYELSSMIWSKFWKHWSDRPIEFYQECWSRID